MFLAPHIQRAQTQLSQSMCCACSRVSSSVCAAAFTGRLPASPTHPIARVVLQLCQHIQDLHSSHLLLKLPWSQHSRRRLPVLLHLLLAALPTHCCCASWVCLTARLQLHLFRFLRCLTAMLRATCCVGCAVSCCLLMLPVQGEGCEDAGQQNL